MPRAASPCPASSIVTCTASTLVTPLEFDRCVLPHGVTTVICDPHEISMFWAWRDCNISSTPQSARTRQICGCSSPPCVPATNLETSGARLTAAGLWFRIAITPR